MGMRPKSFEASMEQQYERTLWPQKTPGLRPGEER
jgi:hypothetical protein